MDPIIEYLINSTKDEVILELCNSVALLSEAELDALLKDVNMDNLITTEDEVKPAVIKPEQELEENYYKPSNQVLKTETQKTNHKQILKTEDGRFSPKPRKRKRSNSVNDVDEFLAVPDDSTTKSNKRPRTVYSREQVKELKKAFKKEEFLNRARRVYLSRKLSISEYSVKLWFQNRRMRTKPKKKRVTTKKDCFTDPSKTYVLHNGGYVRVDFLMAMAYDESKDIVINA